jgi:hypothetical protein
MAGWAVCELSEIPKVTDGDPGDPDWHPLQHFFGLTAFGANVFVATRGDETLVAEHDEQASGQEELYLMLDGEAEFELDGKRVLATRGTVVAVMDPSVKRRAVARTPRATLLAVGSRPGAFATTWRETHFADVPRAE